MAAVPITSWTQGCDLLGKGWTMAEAEASCPDHHRHTSTGSHVAILEAQGQILKHTGPLRHMGTWAHVPGQCLLPGTNSNSCSNSRVSSLLTTQPESLRSR